MGRLNLKNLPRELKNVSGKMIPTAAIDRARIRKHIAVENIFMDAVKLQAQMRKAKEAIYKTVFSYQNWLAKENNCEPDFKSLTLTNYAGTMRIKIESKTSIGFDEHLQLAKQKIDKCLVKWGGKSHPNIKAIVDRAFKVDKEGQVSQSNILGLLQYKFNDATWKEGMDLITKSIIEKQSKEYMFLSYRQNKESDWEPLDLNFSSIQIDTEELRSKK